MSPESQSLTGRSLWLRWVAANGVAELVGLGTTLAMAAGAFSANDKVTLAVGLSLALSVAVSGALVEGFAVGGLQWLAIRRVLPELDARAWVIATSLGAFVAWVLGMLPSTFFSAAQASASAASSAEQAAYDPPLALQLGLAALMGLVLGPILGVPQWWVLRSHLPRAGWWVAANSMAWALGMPMIFLATSLVAAGDPALVIGGYVALGCLAAGLVVGAVHGVWLVRLLVAAGRLGSGPLNR